jgi:hypothetical protein
MLDLSVLRSASDSQPSFVKGLMKNAVENLQAHFVGTMPKVAILIEWLPL